jgi:hypothetical protein
LPRINYGQQGQNMQSAALTRPADPPPAASAEAAGGGPWLTIDQAAAHVGPRRQGRPTSPDTIYTWMKTGLRGITLRYQYRGGQIFTTAAWLADFFEAVDAARKGPAANLPPSPASLERRYKAAAARNRKAGRT